ncbi:hypothetical protein SAMD00019534_073180 [Acytostelium subglobosum LB1]|uniref:hypothetical protein n=1 Tax=Acytostelium subglobosum LB1 TaxID=1410327 RepID=UPI00064498EC|nr:hypothetical protein SAMD00019534_073180 [Acytostelium subglobosum LB1]GAM24143.1 hypothetical protein SAMD00019534_073180 [Acytostelium subglobosum LB1]|eukprot:XP_012753179.1 hypothetical protein SAMD00019534_073180 [Acytostelium subglobosum LB1]
MISMSKQGQEGDHCAQDDARLPSTHQGNASNINLSKLKQGEAELVSAYEEDILNADTVTYIATYNLNDQLKSNRIDSLDCVIDDTVTYIATYNLNDQLKGNRIDSLDHDEPARGHQNGTVPTNCKDCQDRTNVVQE